MMKNRKQNRSTCGGHTETIADPGMVRFTAQMKYRDIARRSAETTVSGNSTQ